MYALVNIVETDQYGLGSVMMWGGISLHSKADLVTVQGRLNVQQFQWADCASPHSSQLAHETPGVMPPELLNSLLL